jgi:probable phosphoglycerate mutase
VILYFARHGESEANLTRTFSNRDLPHHLTEAGQGHAREIAARLASLGVSELWCSPVPRAFETAAIVAPILGLTFQTTEGLREFDVGRFEGTPSPDGWQEYIDVVNAWMRGEHERRVGGGESLTETVARLSRFLQQFIDAEEDQRSVACIAHGGLYFAALPHVFGNVTPEFAFANTRGYGLLITAELRDGRLVCLDWDGKAPEANDAGSGDAPDANPSR